MLTTEHLNFKAMAEKAMDILWGKDGARGMVGVDARLLQPCQRLGASEGWWRAGLSCKDDATKEGGDGSLVKTVNSTRAVSLDFPHRRI